MISPQLFAVSVSCGATLLILFGSQVSGARRRLGIGIQALRERQRNSGRSKTKNHGSLHQLREEPPD